MSKLRCRPWAALFISAACVVLYFLLVIAREVGDGFASDYSRFWVSDSSADAADKGVLIRRIPFVHDTLSFGTQPAVVTDAWIEQATRVRRHLRLFGRYRTPLGCQRLVFLLRQPGGEPVQVGFGQEESVFGNVGNWSVSGIGEQFIVDLRDTVPDTLRIPLDSAAFGRTGGCKY